MGNIALCALKAALPDSPLSIAQRSAVFWLADAANNRTGLAWLAQETLMGLVGCAESTIGPAIAAAEKAGMLSIWRRVGKHSLYLVHPQGSAKFDPVASSCVRDHLSGHFPKSDIEQIVQWMIGMGAIRVGDGGGAIPSGQTTPSMIRGVDGQSIPPAQPLGDSPPSHWRASPPIIGPEPKETRNEPKDPKPKVNEAERREIGNGLRSLVGKLASDLSVKPASQIGNREQRHPSARFRA